MSLVLVFGVVYIEPKNKVKQVEAALPLAGWAVSALGSIVVDVAIDAGIDFLDDAAKNKWKDKKVGELWNKYGDKLKDLKPTKKNAKEWALKAPKWLMAAIIDEVGDTVEDVVKDDTERKKKVKTGFDKSTITIETQDPFYKTGIGVSIISNPESSSTRKMSAYLAEWHDFYIKPIAYEQKSALYVCPDNIAKNGFSTCPYANLAGDENYVVTVFDDYGYKAGVSKADYTSLSRVGVAAIFGIKESSSHYKAFLKYLTLLEEKNMTVYYSDGILATKGSYSFFNLPDTIYDGDESREVVYSPESLDKLDDTKYPMIKEREYTFNFGDGGEIIDAEFEVINEGDEIQWDIIERDIETNVNNYNKTLTYDYEPTINNYYTISETEQDDIREDIEIIIDNEIVINNEGGAGGGAGTIGKVDVEIDGPFYCVDSKSKVIVSCNEIEAVDGSLLDMAKNAYAFATTTIKAGVDSLKSIARTGEDISELFGTFFGWLPNEIRTLIVGGFTFVTGLAVWRAFRR